MHLCKLIYMFRKEQKKQILGGPTLFEPCQSLTNQLCPQTLPAGQDGTEMETFSNSKCL